MLFDDFVVGLFKSFGLGMDRVHQCLCQLFDVWRVLPARCYLCVHWWGGLSVFPPFQHEFLCREPLPCTLVTFFESTRNHSPPPTIIVTLPLKQ